MEILSPSSKLIGRTVIVGIGNEKHGDDAAGIRVVNNLKEKIESKKVLLIEAGTVPENFTSKIKKFEPGQTIIIDLVDFKKEAGSISQIDPENIVEDSVSTHRLPLSTLIKYLENETGGSVYLLGIQTGPKNPDSGMSKEVTHAVRELTSLLIDKLEK